MKRAPVLAALLALLALPASAQTLDKRLGRSFNDQPYEPQTFFFTAERPEGVLQISNVIGPCPDATALCATAADCVAPGNAGCGPDGTCIDPVTHLLGQISVIRKARYCEIAACAGVLLAECGGTVCPAGQTYCPNPGDCASCPLARALCLCDGGLTCPTDDAILDPSWVAFDDTFADASNPKRWSLLGASITGGGGDSQLRVGVNPGFDPGRVDSVSDAAVRFPLAVGGDYVLTIKQGITPFTLSSTCDPYGQLSVFFSTRASTCGVDGDGDGYPAGVDCDDTDPKVHPGATEVCNGKDDNCDGRVDEEPAAAAAGDEGNRCTADACVHGACTHTDISATCDDGDLCTTDTCDPVLGCVHTPISCDDGISCTLDLCDPAVGCRNEPTSDCPDGLGFYRHQCDGPERQEPLTAGDAACVARSRTFSWVTGVADVCTVLDVEPRNDKCKQAEGQYMTLLLNRCKGRVIDPEPIVSTCGDNTTVGQTVAEVDTILSDPRRTKSACTTAQCESEELNSGAALGVLRLDAARRADGGVHLTWTAPPSCQSGTCVYRTWRRPAGAGTYVLVGTGSGTSFEDVTGRSGTDYEYVTTLDATP